MPVFDLSDLDQMQNTIKALAKSRDHFSGEYNSFLETLAHDMERKHIKPLIKKLRVYPAERNRQFPVAWQTEKQQKYIMYMWRKKRIRLPHQRTHEIANAWQGSIKVSRGKIKVNVENTNNASQFVVGRVGIKKTDIAMKQYERPIQKMHKDRWTPAHKVIRPALEALEKDMTTEIDNWTSGYWGNF